MKSPSPLAPLRRIAAWLPASPFAPMLNEVTSLAGRTLARPLRLDPTATNYLNIGCGSIELEGFVNVDFFRVRWRRPTAPFYGADLRHPLKVSSGTVDGILTEHTLEHLRYDEAERLLAECLRILKPGGRLRVVLPDISLFIDRYVRNDVEWFAVWERLYFIESDDPQRRKRRLLSPLQAVSFVAQEYGHVSCWDFDTLKKLLHRVGFRDIVRTNFREGPDPSLLRDVDAPDRRHVSLYAEAVKV